ncbi:MAG: hypothetical protein ABIK28_23055 [Planctomycetota bacterium]
MKGTVTDFLFSLAIFLALCFSLAGQEGGSSAQKMPEATKKRSQDPRPDMEFIKRVDLGKPVVESCTLRCHIDFPFENAKRFNHLTHAPKRGFSCKRCHSDDPLPLETHGKLTLVPGDCGKCHHNQSLFKSCDICHKPVEFQMEYKTIVFDHLKHAYTSNSLACNQCHAELLVPKNQRTGFACLACHHVENPPLDCRACHRSAFVAGSPNRIDGFNHKIHAESRHLSKRCWTCHDKTTMSPLEEMDCQGCHHPETLSANRDCGICHKKIKNQQIERINTRFLHEPHIQKGFPCTRCHDHDLIRSAGRGLDCQGCHHQEEGGCRKCHDHKIYFIRWYNTIPASQELPFLHAVHETDTNCNLCHISGDSIRHGFEAINCADCHHHSGLSPSCKFCHSEIERIRSGMLPSGEMGSADVMYGIVSCQDCHRYNPSSYRGLDDGSRSCIQCHPAEYMIQFEEMQKNLNDALKAHQLNNNDEYNLQNVRQELHNVRMFAEYYRTINPDTNDR